MEPLYQQMNYGGVMPGMMNTTAMSGGVVPTGVLPPTAGAEGAGVAGSFVAQPGANGQVGSVNGAPVYQTPQLTGWQKFGYAMDGLSAIGGLWGAIQQNKIAKQQLALSKEAYNTNMNNSIKTYNTALEDRISARYSAENRESAGVDSYLERNRLSRS